MVDLIEMTGPYMHSDQRVANLVGGPPGVLKQASMAGIQNLIDQVAAGVTDVQDAWLGLKQGGIPPESGNATSPIPTDRFERAQDDLNELARRLRTLADDIRSRQ